MKTSMSLIRFSTELGKIVPVSLGIAPFVPKRNTPLDVAQFAGIRTVERRLKYLSRGLKGGSKSAPPPRAGPGLRRRWRRGVERRRGGPCCGERRWKILCVQARVPVGRSGLEGAVEGSGMTDRERIETWLGAGGVPSTDIERRLIRRLPWVREALSPLSHADIDAAQMGLNPAPPATGTLEDRVRLAQAGASISVHEEPRSWSGTPSKPMTHICGSRRRDCTRSPVWSERPRLGARSRRREPALRLPWRAWTP